MLKTLVAPPGAVLALLIAVAAPLQARDRELSTVESASDAVEALSDIPLKGIPTALMHDAAGVAVIPHVLKAGFIFDGRFGRGVVLARQPDGSWSSPVFLTLAGGGVGWQIGVQSTDLILVFKTRDSLNRILKGKDKITLGADLAVAAGPIGRQAEAATDGQLKAEIYSYSRSRGLFAGVSLEGAGLLVDADADEAFYNLRGGRPADVLALPDNPAAVEVQTLKERLMRLSGPPVSAPIVLPPGPLVPVPPAPAPSVPPVPVPVGPPVPVPYPPQR